VNSDQSRAWFNCRNAETVESSSSSAVHLNASGSSGIGFGSAVDAALLALIASETSGPCRVIRTARSIG
jgi:hypothetical protein